MGFIENRERIVRYSVEYIDKDGKKREDTLEAKSIAELSRKLYEKGIQNILLVFTEKEINIAQYRAHEVEEYINRLWYK